LFHRRCYVGNTTRFPQRPQRLQRGFVVDGNRFAQDKRKTRPGLVGRATTLACGVAFAIAAGGCGARRSRRDIALEVSSATANLVDAHQSIAIAAAGQEMNPIVGAHGERLSVWTYAMSAALLHVLVTDSLPASWRPAWQGASIGLESAVVVDNWRKGWTP
jgi:hypothetical protein